MIPLLEIKNLSVSFRQEGRVIAAVRNISFSLDRGETVALVGESGSGKSVLALSTVSLLGDSALVEGSVTYDGQQMIGAGEQLLQRVRGNDISFIFQEPMTSLNPLHSIERQLSESLTLHQGLVGRAARERILELLTKVGIRQPKTRLDAYPHQLSGGQRQRIMIAMAMETRCFWPPDSSCGYMDRRSSGSGICTDWSASIALFLFSENPILSRN